MIISAFSADLSILKHLVTDCFFLSFPRRVLDGLFKLSSELFGITIKVGLLRRHRCGILDYVRTTLYRIYLELKELCQL